MELKDARHPLELGTETPISAPASSTSPAPGDFRVIKRDGQIVSFDDNKIKKALLGAYSDVYSQNALQSSVLADAVNDISQSVLARLRKKWPSGGNVHIEEIQDQVELALMRGAEVEVARAYIIYRAARASARSDAKATSPQEVEPSEAFMVKDALGNSSRLDLNKYKDIIYSMTSGLDHVDAESIFSQFKENIYTGITESELNDGLIISTAYRIEEQPEYSQVAARMLLRTLTNEVLNALGHETKVDFSVDWMEKIYRDSFSDYIKLGVKKQLLDPRLKDFDLDLLASQIDASQDFNFEYLGIRILFDRYLIHSNKKRIELPQAFFMRVAMGLALNEEDKNARAIEFYKLLSSFDYMCSTPTLFNSGTLFPQLSSCYLTTVPDDLFGIYSSIRDNAMLSKWAGGLGNDWTNVRAMGSHIKGTNGESQGVVPFLKVVNDTAVAVNQGGKRKGAVCSYLESWHLDVEEFLELKKNTGDDRRRLQDMHTANWVPDLFMERVLAKEDWTLFSPSDCPDLHDLYGDDFKKKYEEYEQKALAGEIPHHKRVKADILWHKMLNMLFETGHPWITFKDPCNIRNPQRHTGVIHSSNLCTEITLNTKVNSTKGKESNEDEIAVCNLGSINLANHVTADGIDHKKLTATIKTAVRLLDNVIDLNFYPVAAAERSNMRHRPVGLGLMGFQDALVKLNIPYSSMAAVEFADESMEYISYTAIGSSCDLAQERGAYESFDGSLWSQGILPIDSLQMLAETRSNSDMFNFDEKLDWEPVRKRVRQGIRNSNLMAIAPTATISNIVGVSQSIEPHYRLLYSKNNLSGDFTVVNKDLVRMLREHDAWDALMVEELKRTQGSIMTNSRVPLQVRELFATSFETNPKFLVMAAARRQKWLDQSQSFNAYIDKPDGKKLHAIYTSAWASGLKTTYYLRSVSATNIESADRGSELNAVAIDSPKGSVTPSQPAAACAIDDPDCEACQ